MTALARAVGCALVAVILTAPVVSAADESPERTSGQSETATRARDAFQRGVQLYEERDFGGADVEFRRAYALLPNFRILFNQGRVAVELHDYASAIGLFGRYLSEGGEQVPAERRREVDQEIERLKTRVGYIQVVADEAGQEVYLDEVLVGRTPVRVVSVNVGRHRLELRPRQGPPALQVVDCPGQETVVARFARPVSHPPALHLAQSAAAQEVHAKPEAAPVRRSRTPWIGWAATGLCAVGASVFGVMAYRASNDLRAARDTYPVSADRLDSKKRDLRILGGIADGLLAGAGVLGGLSLYLSFDHDPRGPAAGSVASAVWPNGVNITGHF